MSDWGSLTAQPAHRKPLLAVAAIVLAVAGFLICFEYGHWSREADPAIGRTFPIIGRHGVSYVTAPGFIGVLMSLAGALYVSFNWPRCWGPARSERDA